MEIRWHSDHVSGTTHETHDLTSTMRLGPVLHLFVSPDDASTFWASRGSAEVAIIFGSSVNQDLSLLTVILFENSSFPLRNKTFRDIVQRHRGHSRHCCRSLTSGLFLGLDNSSLALFICAIHACAPITRLTRELRRKSLIVPNPHEIIPASSAIGGFEGGSREQSRAASVHSPFRLCSLEIYSADQQHHIHRRTPLRAQ